MTGGDVPPERPGAPVFGSRGTAALAVVFGLVALAIVAVDLDEGGLLQRPAQRIPQRSAPTVPTPSAAAHTASAAGAAWPATPEGFEQALATVRDALGACHAAWATSDPTTPPRAIAALHLAPAADATARVVAVTIDGRPGAAAETCVLSAVGRLAFTEAPAGDLVVRIPLPLDAPP